MVLRARARSRRFRIRHRLREPPAHRRRGGLPGGARARLLPVRARRPLAHRRDGLPYEEPPRGALCRGRRAGLSGARPAELFREALRREVQPPYDGSLVPLQGQRALAGLYRSDSGRVVRRYHEPNRLLAGQHPHRTGAGHRPLARIPDRRRGGNRARGQAVPPGQRVGDPEDLDLFRSRPGPRGHDRERRSGRPGLRVAQRARHGNAAGRGPARSPFAPRPGRLRPWRRTLGHARPRRALHLLRPGRPEAALGGLLFGLQDHGGLRGLPHDAPHGLPLPAGERRPAGRRRLLPR